jgi:hypothetical protein
MSSQEGFRYMDLVNVFMKGEEDFAYTSTFPSMQLYIFLQSFHSLSHVSAPIGHHQVLLFAKTVNCSNTRIDFSHSYVFLLSMFY